MFVTKGAAGKGKNYITTRLLPGDRMFCHLGNGKVTFFREKTREDLEHVVISSDCLPEREIVFCWGDEANALLNVLSLVDALSSAAGVGWRLENKTHKGVTFRFFSVSKKEVEKVLRARETRIAALLEEIKRQSHQH